MKKMGSARKCKLAKFNDQQENVKAIDRMIERGDWMGEDEFDEWED